MRNITKELNKSMNFNYIIETMSNLAVELTREHRKSLLKEDYMFECENFLYDNKAYPEIKIHSDILKNEALILTKFDKKEVMVENKKVSFYVYKEDMNIILFEDVLNKENAVIRFENNFIREKTELIKVEKCDSRQEKITKFLMECNKCSEIQSFQTILESMDITNNLEYVTKINESILNEHAIKYVTENYDRLMKESGEKYEIAFNEVIIEDTVTPVVTYVDILSEEIDSIMKVECVEDYKNTYSYKLTQIYKRS